MSPSSTTARRGAALSTRQIEQAALRGRKVEFRFCGAQPAHEVVGYVVGMDDYHWMLAIGGTDASGFDSQAPVSTVLVHKSKPDMVVLHRDSTLKDEPTDIREEITAIGNSYWAGLKSNNQKEN